MQTSAQPNAVAQRRSRTLRYILFALVLATSILPSLTSAQDAYLGEIRLVSFSFAPKGWASCNGQLLNISQNSALFSLLGTTYGGDGTTTFALPDMRGRMAIGAGQGSGLSNRALGESGGEETHTLTVNELPSHSHSLSADSTVGTSATPKGSYMAKNAAGIPSYGSNPNANMNSGAIGTTGGSQGFNVMQPYLTLHYIIALQGIFPSPNSSIPKDDITPPTDEKR